jgi:hypothetical protein
LCIGDPRRDRFDRVSESVGAGGGDAVETVRAVSRLRRVGKMALARPSATRARTSAALSHSTASHSPGCGRGCQPPSGASAEEEDRIEDSRLVKAAPPARERRQGVRPQHEAIRTKQTAEVSAVVKVGLQAAR